MNRTLINLALTTIVLISACTPKHSIIELPSVISDNMVLQRNSNATLWGTARPGSKVDIQTSWGINGTAKVLKDSTWLMNIETEEAGGPYNIIIINDDSIFVINNVLLGEVWLCSGQSNMEMPLAGWPPNDTILGSANAIETSQYPNIRMYTVVRNVSPQPLKKCVGSWLESNPTNAPNFSATAYFFGRKLHQELNVPIGLIHSSWGGTPVESWISGKKLKDDPDFGNTVAKLKGAKNEVEIYDNWLKSHKTIDVSVKPDGSDPIVGLQLFDSICANPNLDISAWKTITFPGQIENSEIGEFDGAIWFRKEIEIPISWNGKPLQLSLGAIDDRDVTYFNGVKIGGYEEGGYWQAKRIYDIPSELVKTGKASIALRMIDTQGGGGISAMPEELFIAPKTSAKTNINLANDWHYKVVAEFRQNIFYLFNPIKDEYANHPKRTVSIGPYTATTLYNAMIAPLIPYTIKGAIWYQGEANVGRATQYSRTFPLMIKNWRQDFNNADMPFYFVQLAPWKYGGFEGDELGDLRDAQRRTLALENTGMAVSLDIGNYENIHPCNKTDVGERLARWALGKTYDTDYVISGPLFKSVVFDDAIAKVTFDHCSNGLKMLNTQSSNFEIAGTDGVFYKAEATINGDEVWITTSKITEPKAVRYAYRNGHEATLFNGKGLPASSFTSSDNLSD